MQTSPLATTQERGMAHTVILIDDVESQESARIVVVSDTHTFHAELGVVPDGDIFIHAGDFTKKGTAKEVGAFNDWLATLPHRHRIVITGNHECGPFSEFQKELLTNCSYVEDGLVEVLGLRIYGIGWQRRSRYRCIPSGLDVLITHDPPHGILDGDRNLGNEDLRDVLVGLVQPPRVHLFGHVHEARGVLRTSQTVHVNAASANPGMVSRALVAGSYFFDIRGRRACCEAQDAETDTAADAATRHC